MRNVVFLDQGRQIGDVYTQPQQELVQRILRSIASDDDGFRQLTRNGTFDGSQSLQRCGADIFGDPTGNQQFCWLFTGHHLTVHCDGNSEPDTAFGGPMYYGHSPDGYSERNIFFYQTRTVRGLFDALSGAQQQRAVLNGTPGELLPSVQFRAQGYPGLPISEMTSDQRTLVLGVLRDKDWTRMCEILAPLAARIRLVPVPNERSATPSELSEACRRANPRPARMDRCPR